RILAPGSQNGFDNSGKRGSIEWRTGNNVQHTLGVLRSLFGRYGKASHSDVVTAIELLNERKSSVNSKTNLADYIYHSALCSIWSKYVHSTWSCRASPAKSALYPLLSPFRMLSSRSSPGTAS